MKLHTFFQSGSAYRVRIALNLKRIDYEPVFVRGGRGSQELRSPAYLQVNPQGVVPTLEHEGRLFAQSLPIMEYLEERFPTPSILPVEASDRERVRALAQLVVSDIHPLATARVIGYMERELALSSEQQQAWLRHWNLSGLRTFEALLAQDSRTGTCCHGDEPTLADICLIPQVRMARRLGCDVSDLPTIERIDAHCLAHPAFQRAAPENQPDAT